MLIKIERFSSSSNGYWFWWYINQNMHFWGNGIAEVEKDDSKDTFACDDDAHKADMVPKSHVLWWK